MTNEELQRAIVVWQQTIQVQEHFNDLEMRVRNYALTVLVAVLGATGLALENESETLAAMLILGGLLVWGAFYLMDRWWYHPLLRGAVAHAIELEKDLSPFVPGIGLATAIANASPIVVRKENKEKRIRELAIHSSQKMGLFYAVIAVALLVLFVVIVAGWGTGGETDMPSGTPSPGATSAAP